MGVAALGFTTGGLIGALVPPACWAGALYLGGFLVSLFLSFVLLGRRGALLGSFGGVGAGGVIGFFTEAGPMGIVIGMVLGLLFGIVIGFAPICRGLKINERYVRASLGGDRRVSRRGRDSEDFDKGRKTSALSPNLRERHTRISRESAASLPDHSNEYLLPPLEDAATPTSASTAAEKIQAEPAAQKAGGIAEQNAEVNESTAANEVNGPSAPAKP